ncbi:MAG: peptide deformylase [Sterolibacterium sp.]|jgi:peptide deformylase|nr:peptide deformylase [Sterolibacterium sp.]MBP9800046.1 peptide deformylase [Sterolibacterium sp.]
MALLPILRYPDPRLHTRAKKIELAQIDEDMRQLVADMAETMYAAPGIGLAATQVDRHIQLVVIDVSEDKTQLQTFINPEILSCDGECEGEEGCLSVPGVYESVTRSAQVRIRALGLDGQPFELETEGLLAICLQHEIDHLQGKVFVEYLSRLKQDRIKTRLNKQVKHHERVVA